MNIKLILAECQAYDSPNDLRHAVFMISSVQECRTLLQKHAAEFRKVCIVQYFAPLRVKFTYKNGMTVMIQASESYPQVDNISSVKKNFCLIFFFFFFFGIFRSLVVYKLLMLTISV